LLAQIRVFNYRFLNWHVFVRHIGVDHCDH
jgi:hypothetical protein